MIFFSNREMTEIIVCTIQLRKYYVILYKSNRLRYLNNTIKISMQQCANNRMVNKYCTST